MFYIHSLSYNFRSLYTTAKSETQLLLYLWVNFPPPQFMLTIYSGNSFKRKCMFSPQEGSLCRELINMLEDQAPVREFIREGLSFEMLNTLATRDGGQERFSSHLMLRKKWVHLRIKTHTFYDGMTDLVRYSMNWENCSCTFRMS